MFTKKVSFVCQRRQKYLSVSINSVPSAKMEVEIEGDEEVGLAPDMIFEMEAHTDTSAESITKEEQEVEKTQEIFKRPIYRP